MILATGLRQHRSCSSPGTERNSASPEKLTPHPPQRKSRPRKLPRLRKPPTPRPKRPPKSRRNTNEPETRPRNDRNTSGDFTGNEVKPQRNMDSASTAQNLLSQIRPSAKPALRTTGNPARAAGKRRRLQIRPHSRPLQQHQAPVCQWRREIGPLGCRRSAKASSLTDQQKCHIQLMENVTLTPKEQTRLKILNSLLAEHMTLDQAASLMGVSPRHTRRILAAYHEKGAATVAHGLRGRKPANRNSRARCNRCGSPGSHQVRRDQPHPSQRVAERARRHRHWHYHPLVNTRSASSSSRKS